MRRGHQLLCCIACEGKARLALNLAVRACRLTPGGAQRGGRRQLVVKRAAAHLGQAKGGRLARGGAAGRQPHPGWLAGRLACRRTGWRNSSCLRCQVRHTRVHSFPMPCALLPPSAGLHPRGPQPLPRGAAWTHPHLETSSARGPGAGAWLSEQAVALACRSAATLLTRYCAHWPAAPTACQTQYLQCLDKHDPIDYALLASYLDGSHPLMAAGATARPTASGRAPGAAAPAPPAPAAAGRQRGVKRLHYSTLPVVPAQPWQAEWPFAGERGGEPPADTATAGLPRKEAAAPGLRKPELEHVAKRCKTTPMPLEYAAAEE